MNNLLTERSLETKNYKTVGHRIDAIETERAELRTQLANSEEQLTHSNKDNKELRDQNKALRERLAAIKSGTALEVIELEKEEALKEAAKEKAKREALEAQLRGLAEHDRAGAGHGSDEKEAVQAGEGRTNGAAEVNTSSILPQSTYSPPPPRDAPLPPLPLDLPERKPLPNGAAARSPSPASRARFGPQPPTEHQKGAGDSTASQGRDSNSVHSHASSSSLYGNSLRNGHTGHTGQGTNPPYHTFSPTLNATSPNLSPPLNLDGSFITIHGQHRPDGSLARHRESGQLKRSISENLDHASGLGIVAGHGRSDSLEGESVDGQDGTGLLTDGGRGPPGSTVWQARMDSRDQLTSRQNERKRSDGWGRKVSSYFGNGEKGS
ncbi:hypothetical protein BDZ85DRAFT_121236 [Elsinoe ampelina]|uniref:Uncharacterized protein n=1 Tax=Elsinoe ampelina TaxID=302913 RepID=A0A6A6GBF9_9PEZI|nr:hypothetical protein BDZ85DRAFT_121236 [Elsinoe ampelina]